MLKPKSSQLMYLFRMCQRYQSRKPGQMWQYNSTFSILRIVIWQFSLSMSAFVIQIPILSILSILYTHSQFLNEAFNIWTNELQHWRCSSYVLYNVSLWRARSKITPNYRGRPEWWETRVAYYVLLPPSDLWPHFRSPEFATSAFTACFETVGCAHCLGLEAPQRFCILESCFAVYILTASLYIMWNFCWYCCLTVQVCNYWQLFFRQSFSSHKRIEHWTQKVLFLFQIVYLLSIFHFQIIHLKVQSVNCSVRYLVYNPG